MVLMGKAEAKKPLGGLRRIWENNIKMSFKEARGHGVGFTWLTINHMSGSCDYGNEPSGSMKCGEFLH
jgi:hypothetical protein